MEELLKVSAVAKLLSVNPATVRNMIKRGELRAVDLNAGTGRRVTWRVPISAVVEKSKVVGPDPTTGDLAAMGS
jgi:excisionase family DNA binding protein